MGLAIVCKWQDHGQENQTWVALKARHAKAIAEMLECGQRSSQGADRLFYLEKAKDSSWQVTKAKNDQLNIGQSLSEGEIQKMSDLLKHFHKLFSFNPIDFGDTLITEDIIDIGVTLPMHDQC